MCALPAAAPSSRKLGLRTQGESTANYSGRIDVYDVEDAHLRLHRIRCTGLRTTDRFAGALVIPDAEDPEVEALPGGFDTSWVEVDLLLPSSGWLVLGRDLDLSLYVHGGVQSPNRFRERLWLRLEGGRVVERLHQAGSEPDRITPPGVRRLPRAPAGARGPVAAPPDGPEDRHRGGVRRARLRRRSSRAASEHTDVVLRAGITRRRRGRRRPSTGERAPPRGGTLRRSHRGERRPSRAAAASGPRRCPGRRDPDRRRGRRAACGGS